MHRSLLLHLPTWREERAPATTRDGLYWCNTVLRLARVLAETGPSLCGCGHPGSDFRSDGRRTSGPTVALHTRGCHNAPHVFNRSNGSDPVSSRISQVDV